MVAGEPRKTDDGPVESAMRPDADGRLNPTVERGFGGLPVVAMANGVARTELERTELVAVARATAVREEVRGAAEHVVVEIVPEREHVGAGVDLDRDLGVLGEEVQLGESVLLAP